MKKKFFILFTAFIFTLNAFSTAFAAVKKVTAPSNQTNQLMAVLPNSDAVITIDMLRLMKDAFPQLLASKPQVLTEINAKLDEIKGKTGIDLRQFEQVAVGVAYKKISATETDFEPIILARGKFNAGSFLGVAKLAANGKYREEKIGDKTVYIFKPTEILQENKPQATNPQTNNIIDRLIKSLTNEVALTNYDGNTLAIGSVARVKDTLSNKSRVSRELLDLASRKPNAIMNFGANTPAGISQFIKLDIDEVGKNIDSIRQLYGALDFTVGNAVLSTTARTSDANQAQSLEEMLTGLQMIGKSVLIGAKGDDKKVYANLLEKAVISRKANEVMLDLQIPQPDVDALVGVLFK